MTDNNPTFLTVYRPDEEVFNRLSSEGTILEHWNANTTDEEVLFELHTVYYKNSDLRDWFVDKLYDNPHMVAATSQPSETREFIKTDATIRDRLTIHDLIHDENDVIGDVIANESPGGDIRKYITTLYGSEFSISYDLHRTLKVTITGMEPFSMGTVEALIELDVFEDVGMMKGENPYYPPPARVLEWADRVDDEWGIPCGIIGSVHFDYDGDINGGPTGFVIYDANETVKNWCDDRWGVQHPDTADYPFMRPSEYELYNYDWTPRDAIRMWWD